MKKINKNAQAANDYMILAGLLFFAIIALFLVGFSRLSGVPEVQIKESLEAIRATAESITIYFGSGSATQEIIELPRHIEGYSMIDNTLIVSLPGKNVSIEFSKKIAGSFPIGEGRHIVNIYYNDTHIFIYECGNNQREAFEQCDGSAVQNCGSSSCTPRALDADGCKCICSGNSDCPPKKACINGICQAAE